MYICIRAIKLPLIKQKTRIKNIKKDTAARSSNKEAKKYILMKIQFLAININK